MNGDAFFAIGSQHTICEDYALAGRNPRQPYIILSDGCSSSEHTDLGVRLLGKSAEKLICQTLSSSKPYGTTTEALSHEAFQLSEESLRLAQTCTQNLKIPNTCLDATLLFAYPRKNQLIVHMSGDGVMASRSPQGITVVRILNYSSGAPAYLSYRLDPDRQNRYSQQYGESYTLETLWLDADYRLLRSETIQETGITPVLFFLDLSEIELLALMSDGVRSFKKDRDSIELPKIIKNLLSFKNTKGAFVTRRARRFISRFCKKHNWSHRDDLSIAALYSEPEQGGEP